MSAPMPAREPPASPSEASELTPRQREILALIRQGKANKDIAHHLGIGVGTVKQHVVALFRKLDVTNRAMAVAKADGPGQAGGGTGVYRGSAAFCEGVEFRPATVLSVGFAAAGDKASEERVWRRLQDAAAAVAAGGEMTLVARPGAGVELIFGLHWVQERDAVTALNTARKLHEAVRAAGNGLKLPPMRAGLASGYLLASMGPRGTWTGESVVGRVISAARQLRDTAPEGTVQVDPAAQRLIAFARRSVDDLRAACRLVAPRPRRLSGRWELMVPPPPTHLIGRDEERAVLQKAIAAVARGRGGLVWLEGETGMGKTALYRSVTAEEGLVPGITCHETVCGDETRPLAKALAAALKTDGAVATNGDDLGDRLGAWRPSRPTVVVVDDLHLASDEDTALVARLCSGPPRPNLLVIAAGRAKAAPCLADAEEVQRVRVGRLDDAGIEALVRTVSGRSLDKAERRRVVAMARGVPLFAVGLALEWGCEDDAVPLSLATIVMSRVDEMKLYRPLLQALAANDGMSLGEAQRDFIAPELEVAKELRAIARAGVATTEAPDAPDAVYRIGHPLMAMVLRRMMCDVGAVGGML